MKKNNIQIPLPAYDLQAAEQNTIGLYGFAPITTLDQKIVYEPRRCPVAFDRRGLLETPPFPTFEIDQYVSSPSNRSIFTSRRSTDRPVELDFSGARPQMRLISGSRATSYLPVIWREDPYLIASDSVIYKLTGTTQSPSLTEVPEQNLAARLTALNITESPTHAVQWQNRLWISYKNKVIWSDVNNIGEWREEYQLNNQTLQTLAGMQEFDDEITGLAFAQDQLFVFIRSGNISRVRVLEADIQFGWVPLTTSVQYIGGPISTYKGLFFMTQDSIYGLNVDEIQRVTWSTADIARNLPPNAHISACIDNDTIFWKVTQDGGQADDQIIAFDINRGFSYLVNSRVDFLAQISVSNTLFDQITTTFDTETREFRSFQLAPRSPIAFASSAEANGGSSVAELRNPDISCIRFNVFKKGEYRRRMIEHISLPEIGILEGTQIRLRDQQGPWGEWLDFDDHGVVQILDVYTDLDVEIGMTRAQKISHVDVRFSEVSR